MNTQYKKTISGTIGAGMSALFKSNANYYILEHKASSQYHKAGESQEIIVNFIELGRDKNCGVRFDETFETVSRRHAAIVKDGDNWKLITLSNTNSTFINGQKINNEWYLQNGDEIQLSVNGPKLGFIVPGSTKTDPINVWKWIKLFNEQALRPYRTTLIIIGIILLFIIGGGIGYSSHMNKVHKIEIDNLTQQLKDMTNQASAIQDELNNYQSLTREQSELLKEQKKLLEDLNKKQKELQAANKKSKKQHEEEINNLSKQLENLQQKINKIEEEKMIEEAKQKEIERLNNLNNQ